MFKLLPVHGSFTMPTITLNILAYSNTSSLHTHLTTFNPIPFMTTIISSYSLFFKLLLSYVPNCTYPIFLNMPSRPPRMAPSPRHSGVQRISGQIPDSTAQVRVGTCGSSRLMAPLMTRHPMIDFPPFLSIILIFVALILISPLSKPIWQPPLQISSFSLKPSCQVSLPLTPSKSPAITFTLASATKMVSPLTVT